MSNYLTFPASIVVAIKADTGEEFLLRTDKELAEYQQIAAEDMEERLRAMQINGTKPEMLAARRSMETATIQASFERAKKDRDAALPTSITFDYKLKKPLYREYVAAESMATQADQNGEVKFDQNVFAEIVLPGAVLNTAGEEVDTGELPIIVGRELKGRLMRAIFPDSKRLPFTVLASAPSSKTT